MAANIAHGQIDTQVQGSGGASANLSNDVLGQDVEKMQGQPCSTAPCSSSVSGAFTVDPEFSGLATSNVSQLSIGVGGSAKYSPNPNPHVEFLHAGFTASGQESIYAAVPQGASVKLMITASAGSTASGSTSVYGPTSSASAGSAAAGSSSSNSGASGTTGSGVLQKTYVVTAGPQSITVAGVTYYFLDSISASGTAGAAGGNGPSNSTSFNASVVIHVAGNIKLQVISCDSSGLAGSVTTNPMRVQAIDSSGGVGGLSVQFGGLAAATQPNPVTTDSNGEAVGATVLPSAGGGSPATAHCGDCLAGTDVSCTISANSNLPTTAGSGLGGSPAGPTPSPGGFNLIMTFQPMDPVPGAPLSKPIGRPAIDHIGILAGDTVRFGVQLTPAQTFPDSSFSWSGVGSGSGSTIDVQFPNPGFYTESVAVGGQSATTSIEVGSWPTMSVLRFCITGGLAAAQACIDNKWFGLRAKAEQWAQSVALGFSDTALANYKLHNNRADAARHAYWNALMTTKYGGAVSQGISFGHEYDDLQGVNRPAPSPHNDSLMDLDNNASGISIGSQFTSGATDIQLQSAVLSAISNGQLTILDEYDGNDTFLTGLMRSSNQNP